MEIQLLISVLIILIAPTSVAFYMAAISFMVSGTI